MAEYELWLDESGDFKNEKRKRSDKRNPSLIGGILIQKDRINELDLSKLLKPGMNHATEMDGGRKKTYVLPVLEKMRNKYRANQVFFENTQYEDGENNRQLYLRMMAEGLLQLMLRLNAELEDVQLNVLIARRQDPDTYGEERIISSSEYITELKACISAKKKEHKIILSPGCSLAFEIGIATQNLKLQVADFACNTRLTRNSIIFAKVQDRIERLYSDAFFFSLYEVNSENYIKRCLTQNMISEAIYELYTTSDELDYNGCLNMIISRMNAISYRVLKAQLKQCAADLASRAALEDDYEIMEKTLKKINLDLIPQLTKSGINCSEFQFKILISLADMYLREGDICEGKNILCICENKQKMRGKSLETLLMKYQVQEKKALYEIDSFQYKLAAKRMEAVADGFEAIIEAVNKNSFWGSGKGEYVSEYLGDALCMQIYALMFLQRQDPDLYGRLVELSDRAMKQYPNEKGELERHRQYRSHIELEAGNYEVALQYLMQAKLCKKIDVTRENLQLFWTQIYKSEEKTSRLYYVMYFLLIMQRAQAHGDKIVNIMNHSFEAYLEEDWILADLMDRGKEQFSNPVEELNWIKKDQSNILYHPTEIIYWKYGSFCAKRGKLGKAKRYLNKAILICLQHPNYLTMYISSLGIQAALLDLLVSSGEICQKEEICMEETIQNILSRKNISEPTKIFVIRIRKMFQEKRYKEIEELIAY